MTPRLLLVQLTLVLLLIIALTHAKPSDVKLSRASTKRERRPSAKGAEFAKAAQEHRQAADAKLKQKTEKEERREADLLEIAAKLKEIEESDWTEEQKRLARQSVEEERRQKLASGAAKGTDTQYEMRQRKEALRLGHDVELQPPDEVHRAETVVDVAELHEAHPIHRLLHEYHNHLSLLLVSAECEFCADAAAIFREVAAEVAEEEYHMPREHRANRFAIMNVTEVPERYVELQTHAMHIDASIQHFPVVLFINWEVQEGNAHQPHHLNYRDGKFRADLRHAFTAMRHLLHHARVTTEDDLMHCAFEHYHQGVSLLSLMDRADRADNGPVDRVVESVIKHLWHQVPICHYSSYGPHGDIRTEEKKTFMQQFNPDGAQFAALYTEEGDDDFTVDYFFFHEDVLNNTYPPRKLLIAEGQRFRRWVETSLGRRHAASGRRFHGVHRRQAYVNRGDGECPPTSRAEVNDTVTATVRAVSVDHEHVFFDATDRARDYVVGEPISGLPPWLHDVFDGVCDGTHLEVYSPPKEGFHGELVEINVSAVRKFRRPEPEPTVNGHASEPELVAGHDEFLGVSEDL